MPQKPDPNALAGALGRAAAHGDAFGLATLQSLVRSVTDRNHDEAQRVASALVACGRWSRYVWSGPDRRIEYFTPLGRRLHPSELRDRLSTLTFCACRGSPRPLMSEAKLASITGPVSLKAGLAPPAYAPCFLYRVNSREPLRLSLIRAGQTDDLNTVVEELDQAVSAPAFAIWRHFANAGCFMLTYLLPGPQALADELSRWLRRRPPLSRLGSKPVPIPVRVYDVRTVPPQRRDR